MATKKHAALFAIAIVAGFIAVLLTAFTPAWTPAPDQQPATKTSSPALGETQGRAFAEQLSSLFEQASQQVSSAVVPIFSEQEVKVSSPFGMSDDPFRDFFGDDFSKRFFGDKTPMAPPPSPGR